MAASGSRTAAVSRSAIVNCRMLFPRAPQLIPTDDRNRRGRRSPKGRPKAFLPPSWLTEGLEFVNHGFRRPTRGQSAHPRFIRQRHYGGGSATLLLSLIHI